MPGPEWYPGLFQPCVTAGILPTSALASYGSDAVYLRRPLYVPFFDRAEQERDPGMRALLGHWLLG
jgi:hypothetical protein